MKPTVPMTFSPAALRRTAHGEAVIAKTDSDMGVGARRLADGGRGARACRSPDHGKAYLEGEEDRLQSRARSAWSASVLVSAPAAHSTRNIDALMVIMEREPAFVIC